MGRRSWWATNGGKIYLFASIGDMSRLIAYIEFYFSEGLAIYLQALR
ncbi:hypothetical protein DFAR_2030013 [Desulfarculales bacterium]